eukprot:3891104-Karenia_brevis.AAC.1
MMMMMMMMMVEGMLVLFGGAQVWRCPGLEFPRFGGAQVWKCPDAAPATAFGKNPKASRNSFLQDPASRLP